MKLIYSLLLLFPLISYGVATNYSLNDSQQMYAKNGKFIAIPPATQTPFIAFQDLKSGPDEGLGDGLGSGTVVTLWGQQLGSTQGTSTLTFVDSLGVERTPHIYYWKNADGQLPGGPANLYESHKMQEIAFSIPAGADGLGRIKIVVNGFEAVTEKTPQNPSGLINFTVRPGNIYHVAEGGSNSNPCTFAQPCAFVNGDINTTTAPTNNGLGNARMSAGDIVYSHGVLEPQFYSGQIGVGMYFRGTTGTKESPIAIVGYPSNTAHARVIADTRGLNPYLSSGLIISKYSISVGVVDPALPPSAGVPSGSNSHVQMTQYGRTIGNLLIQNPNTCFTGWAGAIVSGGYGADEHKILGNHIKELGCDNSSRYQHTLYISIREEGVTIQAPEVSYNRLDNNNVLYGIHIYDESYSGDCGDMQGLLKVNHNVITGQRGAGISIRASDKTTPINACWSADLEITNNILKDVGLGVAAEDNVRNPDAILIGGGISAQNVTIKNNIVWGWGEDTSFFTEPYNALGRFVTGDFNLADPNIVIENNIAIQTTDHPNARWIETNEPNLTVRNNLFWNMVTLDGNGVPAYPDSIISDPLLDFDGYRISVRSDSPIIEKVIKNNHVRDVYGAVRGYYSNMGSVEAVSTLLFSENFDTQPDWTTTGKQTVGVLPLNWDAARTDEEWHPSVEAGTKPSMLISGNNPEQVYGGTGKSFITYTESYNALDDNGYTSDGILTKDISPTDEVYLKFDLKFQSGWANDLERGSIKMVRIGHWKGPDYGTGERYKFGSGSNGNNSPILIFNWSQSDYGLRNFHAFRCDDLTTNYFCTDPVILNPPRQITSGDMSVNYTSELVSTNPQIPDLVNGGFITRNSSPYVWHNNVLGDQWNTVELYLKLNSAPGIQDGIYKYWLNGELIIDMNQIPWIGTEGSMEAKWNNVSIGGNDKYHFDLVGDPVDRERWYAIDNIVVRNALPEEF